uniref:MH2 domain-containing protein n=1 Tax=Vespula pensylvanica TaxID=30213 RepID=A0A834U7Y4_VESPE|nr:hypothetical protein H0235_010770 [Vespula pensylvanica]
MYVETTATSSSSSSLPSATTTDDEDDEDEDDEDDDKDDEDDEDDDDDDDDDATSVLAPTTRATTDDVIVAIPRNLGAALFKSCRVGETEQREWCTLAYWELGGRVGRLYPVEPLTVNVFDSLHDGDGLCLATLAENHVASPSVQKTRSKIGLGIMLSQEADGVWAYNRSESPIFVNSPTLDDPESRTLLVYRVPPGFCLNIFDRAKVIQLPSYTGSGNSRISSNNHNSNGNGNNNAASAFSSGPVDINSVRISFAKGWGPKYSRQEVTSCPCWLEVLLAPYDDYIDKNDDDDDDNDDNDDDDDDDNDDDDDDDNDDDDNDDDNDDDDNGDDDDADDDDDDDNDDDDDVMMIMMMIMMMVMMIMMMNDNNNS